MSTRKRALLLVGSPRGLKSTSHSLGSYLLERLDPGTWNVTVHVALQAARSPEKLQELLDASDAADLVVVSWPLYVDSMPAPLTRVMEHIAEHRAAPAPATRPLVLGIVNCGFPEAFHNTTALAICERFAGQAGFDWHGGLAMGMGGAVGGRAVAELGGRARHVKAALDLTAEALAAGRPLPERAVRLMARPLVPSWLYTRIGNKSWVTQARQHAAADQIDARPFEGPPPSLAGEKGTQRQE